MSGFEDSRTPAKDGRRYGPVKGLRFLGLYRNGSQSVIAAMVHGTRVLESPTLIDYGAAPIFVRTINVGEASRALRLRVAPGGVRVVFKGVWGMPRLSEAKKDVISCEKLRGLALLS